jgi:hypothetical protein
MLRNRIVVLIVCALLSPFSSLRADEPGANGLGISSPEEEHDGRGAGGSDSRYAVDRSLASFVAFNTNQIAAGRSLVDIEIRDASPEDRYSGIWFPVDGTVRVLFQGTPQAWENFFNEMSALDGRFLDMEVGYFDGVKRYSAIFLVDGDDYGFELRTTNSDDAFQTHLRENFRAGQSIVDFESYVEPGGAVRYAGVWVSDPKMPRTHLYYGLENADVSDLLRPLHGRVIDYERYWSPLHNEFRHALIVAQYGNGGWSLWRGYNSTDFAVKHTESSNANTQIIDLETWSASDGTTRVAGVWGDTYKSLHEVAPMVNNDRTETTPTDLVTLANTFDGTNQSLGIIGFYGRNVRTHQAISRRATEPFYLASTAKVAVHIRLWQAFQAGVSQTETIRYAINPWYVDDRNGIGLTGCVCSSAPCTSESPSNVTLLNLDRAMMQVSDNAATSMLVDDTQDGVSFYTQDLNEWLGGVAGVGQEFGVVTSIQGLDRLICWQSQVMAQPAQASFFLIPPWEFEPWFRNCGNGLDPFGRMSARFGGVVPPRNNLSGGYARYYSMGLNSATPRAFSRLLEKLWEGEFLDETRTAQALAVMASSSSLVGSATFPGHVTVRAKGGSKSGTRCWTAIFEVGPDAVALGVFTKDNTRSRAQITPFISTCGLRLLQELLSDLNASGQFFTAPNPAEPRDSISTRIRVQNLGGGDATAFDVAFYLSTDATIDESDIRIGRRRFSRFEGHTSQSSIDTNLSLPADVPDGTYRVGFIVDPVGSTSFGEVGESNESNNSGFVGGQTLTVRSAPDPETEFKRGDSDGSGQVEISDAVGVFGFLFLGRRQPACLDAADANDDGRVDISDGSSILNTLFLGGSIPAPGPFRCGEDPTNDRLAACQYLPSSCAR